MHIFFFFWTHLYPATAKAYANEFCNPIIESQETGLNRNIKRTSGPSLAPRQEQLRNVNPDRCLSNIWMKKYSLLNMLPGELIGVLTSVTKVLRSHPPFTVSVSFLNWQAGIVFSVLCFSFWGWEILIYLVFAHTYACRMWKYCCRVLVSLTSVTDANCDESLQLSFHAEMVVPMILVL